MMNLMQREYIIRHVVNGRKLKRVLIDSHYEKRHPDMNDNIILGLVKVLETLEHRAEFVTAGGFEIYVTEPAFYQNNPYRLVWTTHPEEDYIGVINAFRRKRAKVLER